MPGFDVFVEGEAIDGGGEFGDARVGGESLDVAGEGFFEIVGGGGVLADVVEFAGDGAGGGEWIAAFSTF